MAGLVPAIHAAMPQKAGQFGAPMNATYCNDRTFECAKTSYLSARGTAWMAGTSPAMTVAAG